MKKSVVVFSGGMDSTVLLAKMIEESDVVSVLTFDYGQRHKKEILSASAITQYYGISDIHKVVNLGDVFNIISCDMTNTDSNVPKGMYDKPNQLDTIVPNRNMIMLSIATGHAISMGAEIVGYAAHSGDHAIYPDCRESFVHKLNDAIIEGNKWTDIELYAPFVNISKSDVCALGLKLNAPLDLTWSCYEGHDRPCLECGTCLERTEAFNNNGVIDKSLNDDEWTNALIKYDEYNKEVGN